MANVNTLTLPVEPAEWSLPSHRKVGVIGLITTESALFTIFVTAYLFYIGKSTTGPYPQQVLALQQCDRRVGGTRLSTGTYWRIPTLVVDHDSPRGGVLGLHRFRMAAIDS